MCLLGVRHSKLSVKNVAVDSTSKMHDAEGWESLPDVIFAGLKPSLLYPEDRSNTFLWNPGIYLPNYKESHPRRTLSFQIHLPSLKMEESFSKILCSQHIAQIFTIRALVKWNLIKGCSGQGGRDHQASQWHTASGTTAPQQHRCLCHISISDLSAQDQKRAVVLQLVCQLDACTSTRLLSQHSFLHPEQSFSVLLNFIPQLNVNIY
jgi:hypothetical protein